MRTITSFGDRTSGTFLKIASVSQTKIKSVSRTDNFVNVNVFDSVTSPRDRVLSYHCVLDHFSTMPVSFNFNLTFGLKPQRSVASKLSLFTNDPFSKLSDP